MLISADPASPSYWRCWYANSPPRIMLDGVEQQGCVEADTDQSFIVRTVYGDDGRLIVEGDHIKVERMSGRVEIIARPTA